MPRSASAATNPLALLDRVLGSIELTQTQYEEAKTSYEALGRALAASSILNGKYNSDIYPQGSMRLGTTIRPIGGDHFDLDMICWIALSGNYLTPSEVYDLVWDAIGEHETYRAMRSKKNRCIRIKYADSRKFHLDVTPAIPDEGNFSGSLLVPDREKRQWYSSHPKGYADGWFKPAAQKVPIIGSEINIINERVTMANRATIEEMPQYGEFEKRPLQRIIQLLKRHRDEHYQECEEFRPSSILLTTIAAQSYLAAVSNRFDSLSDFIQFVISKLPNYVVKSSGEHLFSVQNPVNLSENFADSWTAEHHLRFLKWHSDAVTLLPDLLQTKGQGIDVMLKRIGKSFGQEQVVATAKELGLDTRNLQEAGKLHFAGNGRSVIGAAGAVIPRTVYFGK